MKKNILIPVLSVSAVLALLAPVLSVYYIDWLWFTEAGFVQVFTRSLLAHAGVFSVFFLLFLTLLYGNVRVAVSLSGRRDLYMPGETFGSAANMILLRRLVWLALPVTVLLSFLFARSASEEWPLYFAALKRVAFAVPDPVFGLDASFHIFVVPALGYAAAWLMGVLVLSLLLSCAYYLLSGQLELRGVETRARDGAARHLLALCGLVFLLNGLRSFWGRYDLLTSRSHILTGIGCTASTITLPALALLAAVSLVAGLGCLYLTVRPRRNFWLWPLACFVLLFLLNQVSLKLLPSLYQRLRVNPNELSMEQPYMVRSIAMTSKAFNLGKITEKDFVPAPVLTAARLAANRPTIENIRLWDHQPIAATFGQLQEMRTYYSLEQADNDRYVIDGRYRQLMLAVREMDYNRLPSRIWMNEAIMYTHGYGAVASYVNEMDDEGLPRFILKDIPPSGAKELALTEPHIYFGERITNEYAIVNTKLKALDYPRGEENVYGEYGGQAGIAVGGLLRRAIFALRFGTVKILLSTDITDKSRFLLKRNILNRARDIAPFLRYDHDPYPVISGGKIYWIIDGYTVSSRFPYSEGSGFDGINYIRNSVKVVVDAYEGKTSFYNADPQDSMLKTYSAMFPGLFRPLEEMPPGLRDHLRYPAAMFSLQARAYCRYHMTDPRVFYNQEDLWEFPRQIGEGNGQTMMNPYYTIMRFPGETKEEYILMLPFTPSNKDNMIAWLAARSDAPHSGELILYRFPKDSLVYGPMQIEARINQDSAISQQFTLWGQKGTKILRGDIMVIPVEDTLVYVEPVYLQADIGKIPELRKVIAAHGDRIAMEDSLDAALSRVLSGPGGVQPSSPGKEPKPDKATFVSRALELYRAARASLKNGDWSSFGRNLDELGRELERPAPAGGGNGKR